MENLFIIYNPVSGKRMIKDKLSDIINEFSKSDYTITIYASQKQNDIYDKLLILEDKYDLICVIGGDGSLNEAINAYMINKTLPPISYIPTGTTNDFARSLKIPLNYKKNITNILKNKISYNDVGLLNNKYFGYVAAFGSISEVSYSTPQASKNILGHNAYVLEGVKKLINIKNYHLIIEYDDGIIEDDICYGMVSNSLSIGGYKFFKEEDISFNDGYFECLFIKQMNNPLDITQTYNSINKKQIKNNNRIYCFKTKHLKITCKKQIKWTLDGEYAGKFYKTNIYNIHNGMKIKK